MRQEEYIKQFKEKQSFSECRQIDEEVWAFDGFHIDIKDIIVDVERAIPAGKIQLYSLEGTERGSIPSYSEWLSNTFGL